MMMICLAEAVVLFQRAELYRDLLDPPSGVSADDLDGSDDWIFGILAAFLIGEIVTGVVFIRWQHRLARNVQTIRGRSGLGPGWAIGAWFIPLASAVLPGVQLFQSSRSASGRGSASVPLWNATFAGGSALVGTFSLWPGSGPPLEYATREGLEAAVSLNYLGGSAFLVLTLAAILGIDMVQRLTRQQTDLLSAPGGHPPIGAT